MGLMNRLLGRRDQRAGGAEPPPLTRLVAGKFAPLPEDGFMKVVGESYCQDELRALVPECVPGTDGRPSFSAVLIPEPENPFDRHAIAVHGPTGRVGYLAREDAERYSHTFDELGKQGYDGGGCTGLLNGGVHDRPNYGVVLTLAYPEVCEMHLGISQGSSATGARRPAVTKSEAGALRGKHFTAYVDEVKTLRRHGHDDSAEELLLELLRVIEAEASEQAWGVAPWYYEQLAIIYRKRRDAPAEVAILERYASAPHAPGAGPERLRERLEKARHLSERHDG